MPTAAKARAIEQAKEWYDGADGVIFTNYSGLSVEQMQKLRADLREKGSEVHVVKNTLFRLAVGDDASNLPEEFTSGTTAVTFVRENETECAKALVDFGEATKKLDLKGGYIYGKVYEATEIQELAKLPGKDVLIAQILGAITAPISNIVGVVEAIYAAPIRAIGAVADKVAEEGGPVESKESTEDPPAAEAKEDTQEEPAEAKAEPDSSTEEPAAEAAGKTEESSADSSESDESQDKQTQEEETKE